MSKPTQKPVIFLPEISGQDREEKVGYLRNLPTELDGMTAIRLDFIFNFQYARQEFLRRT